MNGSALPPRGCRSGTPKAKARRTRGQGLGRHVIVTGGAGFIGSHLVERLLDDGKRVVVIDDLSTGSLANLAAVRNRERLRVITSKVSECPQLRTLAVRAESVYHLAAAVGVELVTRAPIHAIRTNFGETEAMLEAAAPYRVPFLLASSSEVYGRSRKRAFSEEDDLLIGPPHLARWGYACSKLADEFLALAYARERGLPVVIARLFNVVGPRQTGRYGMVLPRFIEAAKAGRPLRVFGGGRQTRCFCWVGDAVEALVRLQDCALARGQVFNVGRSEEISIRALARRVITTVGSRSRIERVPYDKACGAGFEDMRRRKPVLARLAKTVRFRPRTSLRAIIKLTAAESPDGR